MRAEAHGEPATAQRDRPVRNPALRLRGSGDHTTDENDAQYTRAYMYQLQDGTPDDEENGEVYLYDTSWGTTRAHGSRATNQRIFAMH